MATSIVQFRIDDDLKNQATELYDKLGIDLSTAMRMFLKRSVSVNGIPFSMVIPKENYNPVKEMSLEDINDEIASYRQERKAERSEI